MSLCVCVCLRMLGFSLSVFLCVDALLDLYVCGCTLRVSVHLCECVCVQGSSEKRLPRLPSSEGGNGAINSRVSPGGGPATEALARK